MHIAIIDEAFNKKVFDEGDRFQVKLRTTQNVLENGIIKNSYEITEVMKVTPRPRRDQLKLL